jgi:hypothetical protein
MYFFGDTDTICDLIWELLPDDFDSDKLDDLIFIEIELTDMTNKKLTPDPILGFNLALHYAKTEPVIMLGLREYEEFPEWDGLINRKNVAFCKKDDLTTEELLSAIHKVLES